MNPLTGIRRKTHKYFEIIITGVEEKLKRRKTMYRNVSGFSDDRPKEMGEK